MRKMRNEQSFLWKHERKGSLGRPECGLEDYTATFIREVNGGGSGYWIYFPAGMGTTINLCE